jgi:hypothetical protein
VAKFDQDQDKKGEGEPFLEKNVSASSKYSQVPAPKKMTHYKVVN